MSARPIPASPNERNFRANLKEMAYFGMPPWDFDRGDFFGARPPLPDWEFERRRLFIPFSALIRSPA